MSFIEMFTSSDSETRNDTEDSQPSHDARMAQTGRGDNEQQRAEDGEYELFAIDLVSSQCISKETEAQLADDHTYLQLCIRLVDDVMIRADGDLTERPPLMTSLGTVGTAPSSSAKYRYPIIGTTSPMVMFRYPSPKRPTPATARNLRLFQRLPMVGETLSI